MKKLMLIVGLMVCMSTNKITAQSTNSKTLVTYFSFPENDGVDASTGASRILADGKMKGTTEYVAKVIADATGADVFQIKAVLPYPSTTHKKLIDYAKKYAENKTYPKVADKIADFNSYDVVFVGSPNWWYDMPMVIYALFNEYDFSGNTIVPFCTHGGSGFSSSVQTIEKLEPKAKVVNMPAISRNNAANSKGDIKKWLKDNDLLK